MDRRWLRHGGWLRSAENWRRGATEGLERAVSGLRRLGPALHDGVQWWRPVRSRLRRSLLVVSDHWRRSLQFRVVTATLVLSAVVVSVLGYFLMQQFTTDLYTNKEKASANVVQAGLIFAGNERVFQQPPGSAAQVAMVNLARQLVPAGTTATASPTASASYGQGGEPYAVEVTLPTPLQGPPQNANSPQDGVYSGGAQVNFSGSGLPRLSPALVIAVQKTKNQEMHSVWTSMAVQPATSPVEGLLIGVPFGFDSEYQLYYFFPVTAEQASIAAMQRAMLLVGIAVVFLLAAIAFLVTRWVVAPVRIASQGARRLSTGNLTERMEVRGADELAALASSFNEMAANLQEKLEELEDLSQVQRQFVSDVSHELRTPLTTIRIAADVLFGARDELSQAASRSAELLQSQLERFESLLTDLLEISRYDANAATLDAEPADVCTIVRQAADVAQQLAERRGARIEFRLPANACIAEVDRRRVERILRNLLQNAVEHGENREVVVTVAADSAAVAVSVRDFGVGLAQGEELLVFDRFWRADPARARTSGGTGLGLAIALEDARLHGGWLEAWGERGRGSVFRLTLARVVGGELAGSPLPLRPDQGGVDAGPLDIAGLAEPGYLAGGLPELAGPAGPGPAEETQVTSHG
jgi:two-component system, OmpR family, sensor histidine kinase MtrB